MDPEHRRNAPLVQPRTAQERYPTHQAAQNRPARRSSSGYPNLSEGKNRTRTASPTLKTRPPSGQISKNHASRRRIDCESKAPMRHNRPIRQRSKRCDSQYSQPLRRTSHYGDRGRSSRNVRIGGYRRPRRKSRTVLIAIATLIGCIGIFAAISAAQHNAAEAAARQEALDAQRILKEQSVDPAELGQGAVSFSTPSSQWRQGEMPHLYQTDPAWADKPYGGGTVRTNACGPTCMAMVYVYLTGNTDFDPGSLAAWADKRNYAPTGATEWAFMTAGAAQIGLIGENFWPARSTITARLEADQPVIVSVGAGDFTTLGHFIVLKSIDERGMVEVFDPNSALRSSQRWGIQDLLLQITNAWPCGGR